MRGRFLIDEDLSPDYVQHLWQYNATINVLRIGNSAASLRMLDTDILFYCEREHRALVAEDIVIMPRHERDHLAAGRHHWGYSQSASWLWVWHLSRGIPLNLGG